MNNSTSAWIPISNNRSFSFSPWMSTTDAMEPIGAVDDGDGVDLCPWYASNQDWTAYDYYDWILHGVIFVIVCIAGTLGNAYSIFLVTKKFNIRKTIWIYLASMAAWDAILCGNGLIYLGIESCFRIVNADFDIFKFTTMIGHPIANSAMLGSTWMLIVITSERHWAIWRPLGHKSVDRVSRSSRICLLVAIGAVVYNVPMFLELELVDCWLDAGRTRRHSYVDGTALRRDQTYKWGYRLVCSILFVSLVPFIAILVLTLRIIHLVQQARRERRIMTTTTHSNTTGGGAVDMRSFTAKGKKKENTVTAMLLALAAKFLLCQFMPTVLNIWEEITGQSSNSPVFHIVTGISNFLVIVNSATNCLVYFRWRESLKFKKRRQFSISNNCSDQPPSNFYFNKSSNNYQQQQKQQYFLNNKDIGYYYNSNKGPSPSATWMAGSTASRSTMLGKSGSTNKLEPHPLSSQKRGRRRSTLFGGGSLSVSFSNSQLSIKKTMKGNSTRKQKQQGGLPPRTASDVAATKNGGKQYGERAGGGSHYLLKTTDSGSFISPSEAPSSTCQLTPADRTTYNYANFHQHQLRWDSDRPSFSTQQPAHFTGREADIIQRSWRVIRETNPDFGREVFTGVNDFFGCFHDASRRCSHDTSRGEQIDEQSSLIDKTCTTSSTTKENRERKSSLVNYYESSRSRIPPHRMLRCHNVNEHSDRTLELFDRLIQALNHSGMEYDIRDRLRQLGKLHAEVGRKVSTGEWQRFKSNIFDQLTAVMTPDKRFQLHIDDPMELTAAWNRLVCFIITGVKYGFLKSATTASTRRVSAADANRHVHPRVQQL